MSLQATAHTATGPSRQRIEDNDPTALQVRVEAAALAKIEKERDLERSRRQGLDTKSTELLKENAACTKITELEAQVHDPASLAEDTKIEELKARLSDALTKKSRVNSELQAIRTQLKDAQDAADKTHKYHLAALDNLKKAANVQ
ncbi:hypothetical protein OC834_007554 [Tilletia horrida]|nr:hypothetical protein OC834_007554 [Tilletia horrida]